VQVSNDERRRVDPNATIQLDPARALDQVQLVDSAPPRSGRKAPPPLPPSSLPPAPTRALAPAPAHPPKTGTRIAVFVALVALAIAGGLAVARTVRKRSPPPASAASPSASVLTIPPIEIH
jgi:hypothetical protein